MGLYEGIKDVAKIVQQADNIDLYRQLIQIQCYDNGRFSCPHCANNGVYDHELDKNNSFSHAFIGKTRNNHY